MIILGTNSIKATGFDVANSLRFNSASSDNLEKTFGSDGNRKTFTMSCWIKRSSLSSHQRFFGWKNNGGGYGLIWEGSDRYDALRSYIVATGSNAGFLTNRLFRDISAWYHIVLKIDTTQSTEADRMRLYINGVEETSFASRTYPNLNEDTSINLGNKCRIGVNPVADNSFLNGYMSEVCFIDGSALAPDQFGEFDSDSGIWKPINVSGLTFGTNGFYLDFEDSSALGNDAAGSNNFTVNNLTAIDQSTDTCTNNFATLNPLAVFFNSTKPTFSDGNLTANLPGSNENPTLANIGITTGKWYWETKFVSLASGTAYALTGIVAQAPTATGGSNFLGGVNDQYGYAGWNGYVYNSAGSTGNTTGLATYTTGDILSIALDADNNRLYFYKNGAIQNSGTGIVIPAAADTLLGAWFPAVGDWGNTSHVWSCNFGSPPFAISSGNTDGEGFGNFEYAVPSGYFALCTKNLAEYG